MNSQTSFWSERCVWATQQTLNTLLSKLYGSYGAVIAAFSLTAILSACLFIRLRFIPPMTRQSMWGLFGIFTILVFVGSLSGIIAWSFRILIRVEDYTAIKVTDKAEAQAIVAQKYRVQGGWFAFYGLEFFCLSLAKLLVLDHFSNLSIESATPRKHRHLKLLKYGVVSFVVVCNTVGLGAYLFAGLKIHRLSSDRLALSSMIREKAPASEISAFGAEIDKEYATVALSISIQFCSEVIVLLLIISCYLITLLFVVNLVRSAKKATESVLAISAGLGMDQHHKAKLAQAAERHALMATYIKHRIVATVAVVFFALALSVCSAIIFAIGNVGFEYNSSSECGGTFPTGQCWPCQPTGQIIKSWLRFTPEFHGIVVLISAPVTLTLAMWGMLSRKDRMILMNRSIAESGSGQKVAQNYDVSQVTTMFNQLSHAAISRANRSSLGPTRASPDEVLEINVVSVASSNPHAVPSQEQTKNLNENDSYTESSLHVAVGPATSNAEQIFQQQISQPQNCALSVPSSIQPQEASVDHKSTSAAPTASFSPAVVVHAVQASRAPVPERRGASGAKSRWIAAIQSSVRAASLGVHVNPMQRNPDSVNVPRPTTLGAHVAAVKAGTTEFPLRSRSSSRLRQTAVCNERRSTAAVDICEQPSLATCADYIPGGQSNLQVTVSPVPLPVTISVPHAPPRSRSSSRFRTDATGNCVSDAASISARMDSRAPKLPFAPAAAMSLPVKLEEC